MNICSFKILRIGTSTMGTYATQVTAMSLNCLTVHSQKFEWPASACSVFRVNPQTRANQDCNSI